jgi:hypothetical protein
MHPWFQIVDDNNDCRDSMKTNEEVGKEVLAELRERAQQAESDKVIMFLAYSRRIS